MDNNSDVAGRSGADVVPAGESPSKAGAGSAKDFPSLGQKGTAELKETLAEKNWECCICSELLLDPVVGACGHDFCRSCLEQWRKVSEQQQQNTSVLLPSQRRPVVMCPICRAELSHNLGVCQRLKGVVESCFPVQIAKRRAEQTENLTEVERRSRQLFDLQACLARRDRSPPRSAPQLCPLQAASSQTAFLSTVPFNASTSSTLDASNLSSWDPDHPSLLFADVAASPCVSTRSSQTLAASMASLPASAAWLASIPDSHHHHHYHHYHHHHHNPWFDMQSTGGLDQQGGVVSSGGDGSDAQRAGGGTATGSHFLSMAPRLTGTVPASGATPRTPSGHRMSASGTSLPPLPPRRQLFAAPSLRGSPWTPRATPRAESQALASLQRMDEEGSFRDLQTGTMVAMDCRMESDVLPLASSHGLPSNSARSQLLCDQDPDSDGVEHSELTFGGLAGPTGLAQLLQMQHMLQQQQSQADQRDASPAHASAPMRLRHCSTSVLSKGEGEVADDEGSVHGGGTAMGMLQRGLCTPQAGAGGQGNAFQFSAQAAQPTSRARQQPSPAWAAGPLPTFGSRAAYAPPAGRASYDGSSGFGFQGIIGDQAPQRRALPQRRPSEPGGTFRQAPVRAISLGGGAMQTGAAGETKFTAALKRMREEDEAAELAGRPKTSAMRQLFMNELRGGAADRDTEGGRRFRAMAAAPTHAVAPVLPAWPPSPQHSRGIGGRSLGSTPTTPADLPGYTSLSAPGSALGVQRGRWPASVELAAASASYANSRSVSQPSEQLGGNDNSPPRPEPWMPLPSMRLPLPVWSVSSDEGDAAAFASKQAEDPSGLAASFFDSLASTPRCELPLGFMLPSPAPVPSLQHAGQDPAHTTDLDQTPRYTSRDGTHRPGPFAMPAVRLSTPNTPAVSAAPTDITATPGAASFASGGQPSTPMDGIVDCYTPVAGRMPASPLTSPRLSGGPNNGNASPWPPLPNLQRSQSAGLQANPVPSILKLATPVRVARRSLTSLDTYGRTCPSTPRAQHQVPASPFNQQSNSSALIAALMLPPPPHGDAIARAQRASANAMELGAPIPPSLAMMVGGGPAAVAQRHSMIRSLQELVARRVAASTREARPWHNADVDRPVRSACSSAVAAMFADRFSEQLRSHPPGAVFLYVQAIEEHLYYSTPSLQLYADLSTLQARMVQAVDEMIALDRTASV